jgi:hypothetical protein
MSDLKTDGGPNSGVELPVLSAKSPRLAAKSPLLHPRTNAAGACDRTGTVLGILQPGHLLSSILRKALIARPKKGLWALVIIQRRTHLRPSQRDIPRSFSVSL